jgi:hypothetical protein
MSGSVGTRAMGAPWCLDMSLCDPESKPQDLQVNKGGVDLETSNSKRFMDLINSANHSRLLEAGRHKYF